MPTQQGAKARDELLQVERLDQVVVGARFQAGDAVGDGVARGQHQDRDRRRCRISRQRLSPSIPGIMMSRTITSGQPRLEVGQRLVGVAGRRRPGMTAARAPAQGGQEALVIVDEKHVRLPVRGI